MPRRTAILTLVLTLLLSLPSELLGAPVRVINVMPLHNESGQNFCTAWHINSKQDLWATAGHCVAAAEKRGWKMRISGHDASLVFIGFDEQRDLAILKVPGLRATPIKIAHEAPPMIAMGVERTRVIVAGYPYGLPVLAITEGVIAARNVPIGSSAPISDILTVAVAGGNSGSPVLNERGEAVGLLWGTFTESPHSLSIPWEALRRDIWMYFEKR